MTTISLAPVVAFLREHGTLNVLEGAPVTGPARDSLILSALSRASLAEMAGPCNLRGSHLYLGADAVCPAAEGWASRVLAMARDLKPSGYALSIAVQEPFTGIELWPLGWEEPECRWDWNRHMNVIDDGGRYVTFPGDAPSTPAERLRAVLLHELERSR